MLSVRDADRTFRRMGGVPVHALDSVTLDVNESEIVGLVGESGSGKTTLLRSILGLEALDGGSITFDGMDVGRLRRRDRAAFRRAVQIVFQDPMGSLDPRFRVGATIGEGLSIHRMLSSTAARRDRVAELLELVGLSASDMDKYPMSFSGGQRQRIAIARALAVEPRLLICDESVSALDVSVQAQILNLLLDMQRRLGLSILFVSHDLAVVRYVCSRIYVLRAGRIVESGLRDEIFDAPRSDYTKALLAAVPGF